METVDRWHDNSPDHRIGGLWQQRDIDTSPRSQYPVGWDIHRYTRAGRGNRDAAVRNRIRTGQHNSGHR